MLLKLFYDFEFKHSDHYQAVFMDILYIEDESRFDIYMLIPKRVGNESGKIYRTYIKQNRPENEYEWEVLKSIYDIYEKLSGNDESSESLNPLNLGFLWNRLLNAANGYLFQNFYTKFLEYMNGINFFKLEPTHTNLLISYIDTHTNLYDFLNYYERGLADSNFIIPAKIPNFISWMPID